MKLVSLDSEWCVKTKRIACASIARPGEEPRLLTPAQYCHAVKVFAATPDVLIVGTSWADDATVLLRQFPAMRDSLRKLYEESRIFDVSLAEALHAIALGCLGRHPKTRMPIKVNGKTARRYSLEVCAYLNLGISDAKKNDEWRLRYGELLDVPFDQWPEVARQYPLDDAAVTLRVAEAQLKTHRNLHDMGPQTRKAFAIVIGSYTGLEADPARVAELAAQVDAELDAHRDDFQSLGFFRENGSKNTATIARAVALAYGDTQECLVCKVCPDCQNTKRVPGKRVGTTKQCALCKKRCQVCRGTRLQVSLGLRTEKGGIRCDRDTLLESGDESLRQLGQYSWNQKLKSTYLPVLTQACYEPVTFRLNPLLANGRTSYDGIVQLMPRAGGVRECIKAPEGTVFCSIDYSSAEAATWSEVCHMLFGLSTMGEAINAGKDIHYMLAAEMMQVPYESLDRDDPLTQANRQASKPGNYGFLGAMSAVKLAISYRKTGKTFCGTLGKTDCGVRRVMQWGDIGPFAPMCVECLKTADRLREAWLNLWAPNPKDYFAWVAHQIQTTGGEITQLVSGRVRGGCSFTQATNTLFSGLAADGAAVAVWRLAVECYFNPDSPLFGTVILFWAHDEAFLQIPEEKANVAAPLAAKILVEAMREKHVPHVMIDAKPALMRYWLKSAEPRFNAADELIPWDDEEQEDE